MSLAYSKYTGYDLEALRVSSTSFKSPLSVITHIDLDAFYAQVQQVRLGLTKEDPVVCQQWNSIIAVSYAARKFGIARRRFVGDALEKCPNLVLAHVATYKKGETQWAYHDNPEVTTHKVSLDDFRRESRKIFVIINRYFKEIEKASIDEMFIDMGPSIYRIVSKKFPQINGTKNPGNFLPKLSDEIKSSVDGLVSEYLSTFSPPSSFSSVWSGPLDDWDDVFLAIATDLTSFLRSQIYSELRYTSSAGIAPTKQLAKLASGQNKPDNQTLVRSCDREDFLRKFSLTDLWGLGGKLGESALESLGIRSPEEGEVDRSMTIVQDIPESELQAKLGPDLGSKIFRCAHGLEVGEVTSRVDLKSMLSRKNFGQGLKTKQDCEDWMRVFAADLFNRIKDVDEDLGHKRRPKTLTIHYRNKTTLGEKSKSTSIRTVIDEKFGDMLYTEACTLLKSLYQENGFFPCLLLSLAISNFELVGGRDNTTIDSFFKAKSDSKPDTINNDAAILQSPNIVDEGPNRRGIDKFLVVKRRSKASTSPSSSTEPSSPAMEAQPSMPKMLETPASHLPTDSSDSLFITDTVKCEKCGEEIDPEKYSEHSDWHIAVDLSNEHYSNSEHTKRNHSVLSSPSRKVSKNPKQRKLNFFPTKKT